MGIWTSQKVIARMTRTPSLIILTLTCVIISSKADLRREETITAVEDCVSLKSDEHLKISTDKYGIKFTENPSSQSYEDNKTSLCNKCNNDEPNRRKHQALKVLWQDVKEFDDKQLEGIKHLVHDKHLEHPNSSNFQEISMKKDRLGPMNSKKRNKIVSTVRGLLSKMKSKNKYKNDKYSVNRNNNKIKNVTFVSQARCISPRNYSIVQSSLIGNDESLEEKNSVDSDLLYNKMDVLCVKDPKKQFQNKSDDLKRDTDKKRSMLPSSQEVNKINSDKNHNDKKEGLLSTFQKNMILNKDEISNKSHVRTIKKEIISKNVKKCCNKFVKTISPFYQSTAIPKIMNGKNKKNELICSKCRAKSKSKPISRQNKKYRNKPVKKKRKKSLKSSGTTEENLKPNNSYLSNHRANLVKETTTIKSKNVSELNYSVCHVDEMHNFNVTTASNTNSSKYLIILDNLQKQQSMNNTSPNNEYLINSNYGFTPSINESSFADMTTQMKNYSKQQTSPVYTNEIMKVSQYTNNSNENFSQLDISSEDPNYLKQEVNTLRSNNIQTFSQLSQSPPRKEINKSNLNSKSENDKKVNQSLNESKNLQNLSKEQNENYINKNKLNVNSNLKNRTNITRVENKTKLKNKNNLNLDESDKRSASKEFVNVCKSKMSKRFRNRPKYPYSKIRRKTARKDYGNHKFNSRTPLMKTNNSQSLFDWLNPWSKVPT